MYKRQGFGYKPWQGTFYPEKLPKAQQLAYYVSQFSALEMLSLIHISEPTRPY